MGLIDSILKKKLTFYEPANFWAWFEKNEKKFHQLGKLNPEETHQGLDEIIAELNKFNPWLKAVCGQFDADTTELIITADGDIALFSKVQELVDAAPSLAGWRFTAHKPPVGLNNMAIRMYDKDFSEATLHFYPIVEADYPDEVSLVLTHREYNDDDAEDFQTAMSIYVQNGLGEINAATQIDELSFAAEPEEGEELIPISKLAGYLTWREKEFVEKYHTSSIELPEETFNVIEGEDEEDNIMIALVNLNYENWPYKPVFGWLLSVSMEFIQKENGLPDAETLNGLQNEETAVIELLTKHSDTLYTATKTFKGVRTLYFYTKLYEQPSQLMHKHLDKYEGAANTSFFVEKDKYWRCLEEFWGLPEVDEEEEDEEEEED